MVSGRAPRVPARRRTGQTAEAVEVTIPAKPEFISVARLTAATVAGRQGFTYDDIEDLKIAVSEACNALILAGTGGSPLALRFSIDLTRSRSGSRREAPDWSWAPPRRPIGSGWTRGGSACS